MPSKRKEFTEAQKAEIYVRDRALCGFSGVSLWLADSGAAPASIDWIEHVKAAAQGGEATIENGLCASFAYNWAKRDGKNGVILFREGRPTSDYYTIFGVVRPEIAAHIERFSALHTSDWYANRVLVQVRLGAAVKVSRRIDGKRFTRGADYYAAAALRFLEEWRCHSVGVPSLRAYP